ncbi:MAG: polysaccharide deacetylase family protein [Bacillota bacterium]|nr:polysaccharide deacetylase family protein [Bacillota bacterium]
MKKVVFIIFTFILLTCAMTVMAYADEPGVTILLYHDISPAYNIKDALVHTSPQRFDEHLCALSENGYNVISFQQYIQYTKGDASLPENPVIITFDDGYSSVYYSAYPILTKHNMNATVFVISGLMGFNDTDYPHFTWEQAEEMESSGLIDIQSHSNFHYNATEIPYERLILELRKSKYDIETRLHKTCNILAFPYGEYDDSELMAAVNAGFEVVARTHDSGTNRKSDGLYHLNRLFVHGTQTGDDLIKMIRTNN